MERQVSKDDILSSADRLPTARILNKNRYLLHSFACSAHLILTTILNSLTSSLSLPPSTLTNLHRISARSGDVVRLTVDQRQEVECAAPTPAAHGDIGSLSLALLFHRLGGLQMRLCGEDGRWEYVRPLPGHAIVNLGDALATFTNGLLRSCPQRVAALPGQKAGLLTHSVAYFMRTGNEAIMSRTDSSKWS
jgi:isopenicillin N synthase-like dioxygenase